MDSKHTPTPLASTGEGASSASSPTGTRRLKLWELPKGYHCAILGTCLSHQDLVAALPRLQLRLAEGSEDYEVHGFFVDKASSDNPVARYLQKLLDRLAGGEIRRFARAQTPVELSDLWAQALEDGRIGPAFWALLGHGLTTPALRARAHGQVHMLSHHMNGANQYHLRRRSAAEQRCRDLQDAYERLQRTSRQEIAALQAALDQFKAATASAAAPTAPSPERRRDKSAETQARLQRKLKIERQRARAAEAALVQLRAAIDALPTHLAQAPRACGHSEITAVPEATAGATAPTTETDARDSPLRGRTILYVGGRLRAVPVLEQAANRFDAGFLFHDGGLQDSLRTLDHMVGRCDLVCCPVDCVSHGACQRTKQLCKRHQVPFLPLRTSSAANFLSALRSAQGGGTESSRSPTAG